MDITLTDLHNVITEFQKLVTTRLDTIDRRMTNLERDIAVVRDDLHAVFPAFDHINNQISSTKRELLTHGLTQDRTLAEIKGNVAQYRLEVVDMQENLQVMVKMEMTNVGNTLSSRLDRIVADSQQQVTNLAASVLSPEIKTFEEFREKAEEQVRVWLHS